MKGNPNFDKPVENPDAMKVQGGRMDKAFNNRKNGLMGRETYKAVLAQTYDIMSRQAAHVSTVTNGNVEVIASAGLIPYGYWQ